MIKSRRDFLRSLGVGTAAGAALRSPLENISGTSLFQPGRLSASDEFIRLNSNENAYGPSPRVASAIRSAIDMVNRYPFMKYEEVTERIASFHGVKPEQVLFACGSTEILRVAACAFLGSGKKLIQGLPTFESVEHYAKAAGSEVVSVPLDRSFAHDLGRMLSHVDASTGLVYLCNPNNPTGSLTPRKDVENFISSLPANMKVLVDEAYHHYVIPKLFVFNPVPLRSLLHLYILIYSVFYYSFLVEFNFQFQKCASLPPKIVSMRLWLRSWASRSTMRRP